MAINRENDNIAWTKGRYVCSAHFADSDYVADIDIRRLKPNTIPSLNINPDQMICGNIPHAEMEIQPASEIPAALHIQQSPMKVTYKDDDAQPSTSKISAEVAPAVPTPGVHRPIYRTQLKSSSGSSTSCKKRRLLYHTHAIP